MGTCSIICTKKTTAKQCYFACMLFHVAHRFYIFIHNTWSCRKGESPQEGVHNRHACLIGIDLHTIGHFFFLKTGFFFKKKISLRLQLKAEEWKGVLEERVVHPLPLCTYQQLGRAKFWGDKLLRGFKGTTLPAAGVPSRNKTRNTRSRKWQDFCRNYLKKNLSARFTLSMIGLVPAAFWVQKLFIDHGQKVYQVASLWLSRFQLHCAVTFHSHFDPHFSGEIPER